MGMNTTTQTNEATTAKRQTAGAKVGIPPRRMDFTFADNTQRYWYKGSAFLTTFWTTLSAMFPEGETFFCDSVKNYRQRIQDPTLKAQVAGFIGQEAMHSKEHQAFNELAEKHGFPTGKLDRNVGWLLKIARRFTPKKFQLAVTVCLEHYTAILAEQLLREPSHQQNIEDDEARKLWMWHALEENEHKIVAYDVYNLVGGGYWLRTLTMLVVTLFFFAMVAIGHAQLLKADGKLLDIKGNLKGLWFLWSPRGLFPRLLPQYLDFFRPGFHPNDHDTVQLLEDWRQRLFNRQGMLAGKG
ncbi:hypothetical protein GCM10011297_29330 [Bacterioplanes sanyensis]|nr:hypothetical protein GCM10011297_29330 [Bacterioplanes sanyensis]